MTEEAIAALRARADLARRLAGETRDPAARVGLLQIASTLRGEAETLEAALQQQPAPATDND